MANFVSLNQIQIQIGFVLLVLPDTHDNTLQSCIYPKTSFKTKVIHNPCLGVQYIKLWVRNAEEGMCRGNAHQSDVVMLQDMSGVNILFVAPHKVVELMDEQHAVGAPRHDIHHLRRVLVLFRPLSLLSCAMLGSYLVISRHLSSRQHLEFCRVGKYLRYSIERYRKYSLFVSFKCILALFSGIFY